MNNSEQLKTKPEDLLCQNCLMREIGAGQTTCSKHGQEQIDWKCMYCCAVASFKCFGTHYMCTPCHSKYPNIPLKDCGGVNCPLGIAHPPASADHKLSVFPLGCGICRSEKTELLKHREIQQVLNSRNIPDVLVPFNEAIL